MLVSISLCIEVCVIDPGEHPGDSTVNHFSLFMPLTSSMHVTAVAKACVNSLQTSIYSTISSLQRYLTLAFWLNNWPLHGHYHVTGSFIVNLWRNYCHINHPFVNVRVCVQPRTIQFVCRIIMRTSHRGHCQNGGHAPGSEGDCNLHLLFLIIPVILSLFYIILSSVVTDDPLVCSISNPDFVIYSSVVSFYLPFIVTLLVYIRIYIFLRMRRKRITFGQASGKVQPGSTPPSVVRQLSHSHFHLPYLS